MTDATAPTAPGAPAALDGIRVLELGSIIAGPFCGRLLADHGADVIKIEAPGAPDPLRDWGQAEEDGHHFFFTVHARNKRCVTLDLRRPEGKEILLQLVYISDVLLESFRPGTLERWGLGPDVLQGRNPGLPARSAHARPRPPRRIEPRRTAIVVCDGCVWPIGDPGAEGFHFCGHRNFNGLPYCEYHSRLAYQPVNDRRRDRDMRY